MNQLDPHLRRRQLHSGRDRGQGRHQALVAVLAASLLLGGLIAFAQGGNKNSSLATSAGVAGAAAAGGNAPVAAVGAATTVDPAAAADAADVTPTTAAGLDGVASATAATDGSADLVDPSQGPGSTCLLTVRALRIGDTGDNVTCLQHALVTSAFYTGPVSGTFDQATADAVKALQTKRDLFVDGIVGRESAISLGIWPAEGSTVVHTPPPPAGAKDSLGFPLSSVSSIGAAMPPLPANSGTGKRLVYDRVGQRVWAVSANEVVIRSWLVSGSKFNNEEPGVHHVYSRSDVSTAWNGKAYLPHMVRYQKTKLGNIGFHGIPIHVADKTPYQTEAELGTRLSGGCQRQANPDADFVWAFAQIGTTVVVI